MKILYPALIKTTYCCFDKWAEYSITSVLFSCIEEAELHIRDSRSAHTREVVRLITEQPFKVSKYGDYTKYPYVELKK